MTSLITNSPGTRLKAAIIALPHEGAGARIAPLGAMAVAAFAERELGPGVSVQVFDCAPDDMDGEALLARLADAGVAVVGFQIFSSQVATALSWARQFKARLPEAVLVAGGHHPTLTWANFVRRHGRLFDATIHGDGEVPFTAILRCLQQGDDFRSSAIAGVGYLDDRGQPVLPPDEAPLPIERAANMLAASVHGESSPLTFSDAISGRSRTAVALISSRSCPLKCSFCSIITMPGKWRANDSGTVVGWLVEAHARKAFEHVYFMDANFFVVPRRVREIATALSDALPGVTWSASSTVKMFLRMEEDLELLVNSGLRMVELGIESGSQRQLSILNKNVTVAENRRAVELLQIHGLQIGLDFIMFFPDQTLRDLRENLDFLEDANLLLERSWDHLLNTLELYPGTPLRSTYSKMFNLVFDDDELPEAGSLFMDPAVASVHRIFTREFAPRWLPRIDQLYGRLAGAAQRARRDRREEASRLLLEAIAVRHLPYKVLRGLINSPNAPLEVACPWLAAAEARILASEALASQTVAA